MSREQRDEIRAMLAASTVPPGLDAERFWSRVRKTDSCWEWQGATAHGYGRYQHGVVAIRAHRLAFLLSGRTIPHGLVLDHLCRNRACVRPDHLEPVPHRINVLRGEGQTAKNARKTACHLGHPLTPKHGGGRECRVCHRATQRRAYRKSAPAGPQRAYLTAEMVVAARMEHASGISKAELARRYGVGKSAMRRAISGKTWRDL